MQLNIVNDPSPFAWHHVICLAKDASDKAFDESLFLVLPEITTVPIMTFSTDGILKAMTPHWKSIRAVASAVLARQTLGDYSKVPVPNIPAYAKPVKCSDLNVIARVVQTLLQCLATLQTRVIYDLLGPLDVNVDDIQVVDFAREDVPQSLEYPS